MLQAFNCLAIDKQKKSYPLIESAIIKVRLNYILYIYIYLPVTMVLEIELATLNNSSLVRLDPAK